MNICCRSDARGRDRRAPQISVEVTREAIPGAEPWKRPLARITDESSAACSRARRSSSAFPVSRTTASSRRAGPTCSRRRAAASFAFPGGELRVSPTPAMTLIDVDGHLPPASWRWPGRAAAARAILRIGIGGSIGIDLPTVAGKAERQAVGAAVDAVLPQPFERTAVNGFGFLQIVRPRRRASLFELAADRAAFEARALLRRAALERARRNARSPLIQRSSRCSKQRPTGLSSFRAQVGGAVDLAQRRLAPHSCGPMPNATDSKSCPSAASRRRGACALSARRGCKDRDLLNWLGEGYRIPGPPADPGRGGQRGERQVRERGAWTGGPPCRRCAQVAQLVEHVTENHGVGGSIPSLGTTFPNLDHTPSEPLGSPDQRDELCARSVVHRRPSPVALTMADSLVSA